MIERVSSRPGRAGAAWGGRLVAAGLVAALAACNPDPRGQCNSDADCIPDSGTVCALADHLCELPCNPVCDAGYVCSSARVCAPPAASQVSVKIDNASDAIFSPSNRDVQISVSADDTVTLGALTVVAAKTSDGGVAASGSIAQAAVSADGGVVLMFAPDAQGQATLIATLAYTPNGGDGGQSFTVSSTAQLVTIDAVPPALTLSIEAAEGADAGMPDQVDGWFARTPDGGIAVDARIDDTDAGSGPDGGTLTFSSCDAGCTLDGQLVGSVDAGVGLYRFAFARALAPAGAEGAFTFSVEAVDNAGNSTDRISSVLIDDKAPQTDAAFLVDADGGKLGEDQQPWFPAGTSGVDVEVSIAATDNGVGLDPASFQLTLDPADIDSGQSGAVTGYLPTPPDGRVHFKIPTGRASHREGPLRFTATVADKLGHVSAPAAGQILIDDAIPSVSVDTVDYGASTPLRAAVCAPDVSCGRGPAGAEDHALRDDVVTVHFSAIDCGAGIDQGALPATSVTSGGQSTDFSTSSTLLGSAPGDCANGSANRRYLYAAQIDLGATAPLLTSDANGDAQVYLTQVAFDRVGGEAFNATPGSNSNVVQVSRVRWKALLAGHATGAPALMPALTGVNAANARRLVVPVDGATSAAPDGLEVLDGTGALLDEIQLTDGGAYDRATGDVAVGATGSLWIAGTPSCNGATCTSSIWTARLGLNGPSVAACPTEGGVLGSLALRAAGASGVEVAVAGVSSGDLGIVAGYSFTSTASGTLSCSQAGSVIRAGFSAATGVSLAGGDVFLSGAAGFFSTTLDGNGVFGAGASQSPLSLGGASSGGSASTLALAAAPSLLGSGTSVLAYFGTVDSLSNPTQELLREAAGSTCAGTPCWIPEANAWGAVPVGAPVLHTPVFDGTWVYTTDEQGTLQLSSIALGSNGKVNTVSAGAASAASGSGGGRALRLASGGGAAQLVSAPVLVTGGSAGSSALVVQANGLVRLHAVTMNGNGGGSTKLSSATQLTVGTFAAATHPPAPVVDARGTGSVAYVIDGGNCATAAACGAATVWALQLDAPAVAASTSVWPRPGHDNCNSRQADGSCP